MFRNCLKEKTFEGINPRGTTALKNTTIFLI